MWLGTTQRRTSTGERIFVTNKWPETSPECLYKSWTLLSMKFAKLKVHAMVDGSPAYLDAYLSHARVSSTAIHVQANTEWANRTLLNVSQILEVFSTLCQEDPSHSLLPTYVDAA
ncbi:hypothetical protein Pst134EA_015671 [Puccinia striiformis f. sp. tritici]|uniref:hypothetical protein n=1 Tax=Puccinia striiformis f. sp. tritici TaxID=168172 RepID=UPI0020087E89|nr:hypothetical protein Pst134EA_015671 [Puccinia striiformis f. sp. tritici]KAH9463584.1 hypothetical protein Pst134EA_015671 [Puccinia striiformis f. sp. tritici]